jgi:hypothetical protein
MSKRKRNGPVYQAACTNLGAEMEVVAMLTCAMEVY